MFESIVCVLRDALRDILVLRGSSFVKAKIVYNDTLFPTPKVRGCVVSALQLATHTHAAQPSVLSWPPMCLDTALRGSAMQWSTAVVPVPRRPSGRFAI